VVITARTATRSVEISARRMRMQLYRQKVPDVSHSWAFSISELSAAEGSVLPADGAAGAAERAWP